MSQPSFPPSLLDFQTPEAPPPESSASPQLSPELTPSTTTGQVGAPIPPPQPLRLSVIVPSYNAFPSLMLCLRSLLMTAGMAGQTGRLEILCQDDCSDFDAPALVIPPVKTERNAKNLGFAGNCNAGAARAQGDLLLFLNQDTVARPGWFEALMAAFNEPEIGIVGPKLVFPANTPNGKEDSIQSCGGLFDVGRGPFHRYLGYAADDRRVNARERVSWTTGAALAIWRELFYQVGGFDVGYEKGYFEDVDLAMKVRDAGYETWYEPGAVFEHSVASTGGIPAHVFKANSTRFHAKWDAKIVPDVNFKMVDF